MSKAYYNENDRFCAAWLRELIKAGHIAPGEVDERDIQDVTGDDLNGFEQCHFFAGIGGWSYALRLAGVPDEFPIWTGSCPCQPFSQAGKRKGTKDERHLWPDFHRLIEECRPAIVFGEQVASKDGREWFDGVRPEMEALEYEVGCADLCAAGIGTPQKRQRLYFVGRSNGIAGEQGNGWQRKQLHPSPVDWQNYAVIPCGDGKYRRLEPGLTPMVAGFPGRVGRVRGYGNAIVPELAAEFIQASLEALIEAAA